MKTIMLSLITLFIFGGVLMVYTHELVHSEIYRHYGIESEITWFYIEEGESWWQTHSVTIAESPCPTEECKLAQNMNEVVGYPLMVIYSIFACFLYIIAFGVLAKVDSDSRWRKEEEE